jgi:hypothetical protein
VVGAVHDELDAASNGTELSDDQFVADERIVVQNVAFEIFRVFWIIVITVVTYNNVGIGDSVLDEAYLRETNHGMLVFRTRAVQDFLLV